MVKLGKELQVKTKTRLVVGGIETILNLDRLVCQLNVRKVWESYGEKLCIQRKLAVPLWTSEPDSPNLWLCYLHSFNWHVCDAAPRVPDLLCPSFQRPKYSLAVAPDAKACALAQLRKHWHVIGV